MTRKKNICSDKIKQLKVLACSTKNLRQMFTSHRFKEIKNFGDDDDDDHDDHVYHHQDLLDIEDTTKSEKIDSIKFSTEIDMSQSILTEMKNHSNIESITKTEFDKVCEQKEK